MSKIDLSNLSTDELIDLKEACSKKLEAALNESRRTLWTVSGIHFNSGFFRDSDYLKAMELFLKEFAEDFPKYAQQCIDKKCSPQQLIQMLPRITANRITETDYFNEWFPEDKS